MNVCVCVCVCVCVYVRLFVTSWTVTHQVPLSVGFSRQEYWSGLSFPSSGSLPNPGFELRSPTSQVESLLAESTGKHTKTGSRQDLALCL